MALIGYARVSKSDGPQTMDLQRDAFLAVGADPDHMYEDKTSGNKADRPELASCLKALRAGDSLLVWKLDRLGRNLRHLVNIVHELPIRGVGLKVLTGQGAEIDLAMTSMGHPETSVAALCKELEVTRQTLYRHVSPTGELREDGRKLLARR